ncbi:MAG: leucine--tRNA ligase [Minisyncoccota bacterium]
MKPYDHKKIEKKWQKKWATARLYKTEENKKKPKCYVLDMFPYPSGEGLHVGHPKGYIATDIYSRYKTMTGHSVLHPMGWDAFGLPAENFAIKNKVHPKVSVAKNVKRYKEQLSMIGFNYDWERELNTIDPAFYKWTQWIFLEMYKKGLAYESYEPINWCPSCQTGLANEDLEDGKCERCGSLVERKPMRQWVLKITKYADRLLNDLDKLDWPESIKESQRNWIGRSEGVEFTIPVADTEEDIKVFTTRIDTVFGMSYVVLAPEHPLVEKLAGHIKNIAEVRTYATQANKKSDLERTELAKDKTGVKLEGVEAINPFNGKKVPVFIADYVLGGYGTGAVMAVPAHDERDFAFAKKYGLPISKVILPKPILSILRSVEDIAAGSVTDLRIIADCFVGEGYLIDSGDFAGLDSKTAREKMTAWLVKEKLGKKKVNYKLREWVFSRQRYWGEPIPIIHCAKCGAVAVPEKDLPVKLPEVKSYAPTGTGESPLADIKKWVNTKCPKCKGPAKRETNTMPQWAGSSWYYLRYIDPKNKKTLVDKKKEKYWSPVDMYVGGAEHATRHLIYARFWHKFLYDIGAVNYQEPFTRLQNVGLIMAEDGRKMSKRYGNVINPDDIVKTYGADTLRLYEMFMGPFDQSTVWSTKSIIGPRRFLERVWRLAERVEGKAPENKELVVVIHRTIKKLGEDVESFSFNTAISALMVLLNEFEKSEKIRKEYFVTLLVLLAPFAPHMTEELWQKMGQKGSIHKAPWPKYDKNKLVKSQVTIAVQVNGRVRDIFEVAVDVPDKEVERMALGREKIKVWIAGKKIQRLIYVQGKLVNIVVG